MKDFTFRDRIIEDRILGIAQRRSLLENDIEGVMEHIWYPLHRVLTVLKAPFNACILPIGIYIGQGEG